MKFEITKVEKGFGVANFDETKKYLVDGLKKYDNYVVDEENYQVAKSDRADLNNLAKEIDNERKRVKKLILEVYDGVIEPQCKELVNLITSVSSKIDEGVKLMESNAKAKKLEVIKEIWEGYHYNLVDLDKIFDETWLNKGTSEKQIQSQMSEIINNITKDLSVLETLNPELKSKYLVSLDLAATVTNYNLEQEASKRLNDKPTFVEPKFIEPKIEEKIVYKSVDIRVRASESKIIRLGALLRNEGYEVEQLTEVSDKWSLIGLKCVIFQNP